MVPPVINFGSFFDVLKCFFFQKVILLIFKEFHGLQNDLKIFQKHLTPGRYRVRHFGRTK